MWEMETSGGFECYRSREAGLTFHLSSCELFWRNQELKPVPDSMSHFQDYEVILGKDILQCGNVHRSEHRHWVHIVGTPYDVVEWDEHDPRDQGINQPRILLSSSSEEDNQQIEKVVFEGQQFTRIVDIYDENPWKVKTERWAVDVMKQVLLEAFPMPKELKCMPLAMDLTTSSHRRPSTDGKKSDDDDDVMKFLMFDEQQYEKEEHRASWKEFICTKRCRRIPGRGNQHRKNQSGREDGGDFAVVLSVYNLTPHARRLYRSLIYSTDQTLALHSLPLLRKPRRLETMGSLEHQAGEIKRRNQHESTLEIHRYNKELQGREVYVPPRLLQGLIPSALLEAFLFWQGEDGILRGYTSNASSSNGSLTEDQGSDGKSSAASAQHWFNYSVEVVLSCDKSTGLTSCQVWRRNDKHYSNIVAGGSQHHDQQKKKTRGGGNLLLRRNTSELFGSSGTNAPAPAAAASPGGAQQQQQPPDVNLAMLAMVNSMFPQLHRRVVAYALKTNDQNPSATIAWLTDVANLETIEQMNTTAANSPQHNNMHRVSSGSPSSPHADQQQHQGGNSPPNRRSFSGSRSAEDLLAVAASSAGGRAEEDDLERVSDQSLVLLNVHAAAKLSGMSELLRNIEDASHVLVWATKTGDEDAVNDDDDGIPKSEGGTKQSKLVIQVVELPRLQAKFQPKLTTVHHRARRGLSHRQQQADGDDDTDESHSVVLEDVWRLCLVDHPGWFVASGEDLASATRGRVSSFPHHLSPFSQCVLLHNSISLEFAFMVPNHDFAKLRVEGNPFGRHLMFDRSSLQWQESVPSPFYLYTIHPSQQFLVPPSLSASLYLAVMLCAVQRYEECIRSLEACYADTAFSVEESFMFALMGRTLDPQGPPDLHPDAHACRLKLAHACLYSPNKVSYPVQVEAFQYLDKARHVSVGCKLSRLEVLDLLKTCSRAEPLVRTQLEMYAEWTRKMTPSSAIVDVDAKIPSLQRPGQPWYKLTTSSLEAVSKRKLTRIQYKQPKEPYAEDAAVKLVWEDLLMTDEESGSNSQLGFFFLYLVRRQLLPITLLKKNCSQSFASILGRMFHLRHARWGKEATSDGESEVQLSYAMAVLHAAEMHPEARWPTLTDRRTLAMLERGLSTTRSSGHDDPLRNPFAFGGDDDDEASRAHLDVLPTFVRSIESVMRELYRGPLLHLQHSKKSADGKTAYPSPLVYPLLVSGRVRCQMRDHLGNGRPAPSNTAAATMDIAASHLSARRQLGTGAGPANKGLEDITVEELVRLGNQPLFSLPMLRADPDLIKAVPQPSAVSSSLPFSIRDHEQADSIIAQDLLNRLEKDVQGFAEATNKSMRHYLTFLDPIKVIGRIFSSPIDARSLLETAKNKLNQLAGELEVMYACDDQTMSHLAHEALLLANSTTSAHNPQVVSYLLRRTKGHASTVKLEWLLGASLSSSFHDDLSHCNPFHGDASRIKSLLGAVMLLANRKSLAAQALSASRHLSSYLDLVALVVLSTHSSSHDGVEDEETRRLQIANLCQQFAVEVVNENVEELQAAVRDRLLQLSSSLVDLVTVKRHYVTPSSLSSLSSSSSSSSISFDPRFLIFEFIFSIVLRKRQVEMVNWFVDNVRRGNSRVQQMMMGQGKTTVVGPLLALVLADGETLVTQVMPTSLLEQTRTVLRKCFSVLIPKRVYTLQFDRACEDSPDVAEAVYQKLLAAERGRGIVVSAPECIKALMLKAIEQLHAVEATPVEDILLGGAHDGNVDERQRHDVEALHIRTKAIARSSMADAISPILCNLWRNGVLIMDEVDVLLHPLRSELNFPIGMKDPIELSGPRWYFPIHLLDSIFYLHSGKASRDVEHALQAKNHNYQQAHSHRQGAVGEEYAEEEKILIGIANAVREGYATCALQREPHLALLDLWYYETCLKPALIPWASLWLWRRIVKPTSAPLSDSFSSSFSPFANLAARFMTSTDLSGGSMKAEVESAIPQPSHVQLLFLARAWVQTILPHVLSKINRVGFGLLQPGDASASQLQLMPLSRRLMAVPFVAKDVPSRSSEFAHPDVLIGLTVLGYRYQGLRLDDTRALLTQIKQDFSRQMGPKEHRPASALYSSWLAQQHVSSSASSSSTWIPLSQLQPLDRAQLVLLHQALSKVPDVVHYYLCQHVFPRTMNFQQLKVSACGHELGSDMLFSRARIGFSGTPSNLLPLDLGECFYEPGSDGKILSVLTDPRVTSLEDIREDWTPLNLLQQVATSVPSVHALIDTGALITNMENEEVARFLLKHLPPSFEAVVYLDKLDRQMVVLRSNNLVVPSSQCGVALSRRFTFFDQVHTTGTDVKQCATATAVVTLGKDMVFRDYAQGCYRMRGIGNGQRIRLYVIPEVRSRICRQLGEARLHPSMPILDVPAWLLLNSMRVEGLQYVKLCQQEIANVWRKHALKYLVQDMATNSSQQAPLERCLRFTDARGSANSSSGGGDDDGTTRPSPALLRMSINEFREAIAYPVPSSIEPPISFQQRMQEYLKQKPLELLDGNSKAIATIEQVMRNMTSAATSNSTRGSGGEEEMGMSAEVEHEQEAEEEQEQEAEQEEQRVSAFSRDDETHIQWSVFTTLASSQATAPPPLRQQEGGQAMEDSSDETGGSSAAASIGPFYSFTRFQVRPVQPKLAALPTNMYVSDNFFRAKWSGLGERRLKNAVLFIQWTTTTSDEGSYDASSSSSRRMVRHGLVTLAEGESLRWLVHHSASLNTTISMSMYVVGSGSRIDATSLFLSAAHDAPADLMSTEARSASLFFRFFNSDMFYVDDELELLEIGMLRRVPIADRLEFFLECLRLRRRHRNQWEDSPIAKIFTPQEQWGDLRLAALLRKLQRTFSLTSSSAEDLPGRRAVLKLGRDRLSASVAGNNMIIPIATVAKLLTEVAQELRQLQQVQSGNSTSSPPAQQKRRVLPSSAYDDAESALRLGLLTLRLHGQGDDNSPMPPIEDVGHAISIAELQELFPALVTAGRLGDDDANTPGGFSPTDRGSTTGTAGMGHGAWQCQTCTSFNPIAAGICSMCETPAPEGLTAAAPSFPPWSCPMCTFINEPSSMACAVCGGADPDQEKKQRSRGGAAPGGPMSQLESRCPEGFWVCSVETGGCSKFNPKSAYYCDVCDRGRPNLSSMRF